MLRYFLIFFLSFISEGVFAQVEIDSINGPVVTFFELQHDFGDVIQGDSVNYIFKFKNTGNAPLKIHRALSTCQCTPAAGDTSKIIMPGEIGEISVGFKSAGKEGIIQKQVTVFSNAINSMEKVTIRVNVLPPAKKTSKSR